MPLFFASRCDPISEPQRRRPRQRQSEAANALLSDLRDAVDITEGRYSKSHSRALCAAALAEEGKVGVDVEWIGAAEAGALARFVLDTVQNDLDPRRLYKVWTFRESYYKAFGDFPPLAMRRALFEADPPWNAVYHFAGCAMLFQETGEGFVLCALWDGGEEIVSISL